MQRSFRRIALLLAVLAYHAVGAATLPEADPALLGMDAAQLAAIDRIVEQGIHRGDYPGAVVVVGRHGRIAFQRAYGYRTTLPRREPMTLDTVFDIASLTKVVATAPAIMKLIETGRLRLDDKLGELVPECDTPDKRSITVRQLLAHDSGMRPGYPPRFLKAMGSYEDGVRFACRISLFAAPGRRFRYSDLNYVLLGEIVRRVSGEPLEQYVQREILVPLGMTETVYTPRADMLHRLAGGDLVTSPTEPGVALRMGGVSGHSGLHSTAGDLAVYCAAILAGGGLNGRSVLSPLSVQEMTRPAARHGIETRGLGFDIDTGYSVRPRGSLFPVGSFGHTGYSGVSMWLDPGSDVFVIILTNRLHPAGQGDVRSLRAEVATAAAASAMGRVAER